VCHGDFHPGNVILGNHTVVIIDWIDAARGNPTADTARTSIILRGITHEPGVNGFMRLLVVMFHRYYLRHYLRKKPEAKEEYLRWLPITAAARLSEGISQLEPWLIDQAGRCGLGH
jgi:aminoglycoside phosphotransferase (APT) family kinase protein